MQTHNKVCIGEILPKDSSGPHLNIKTAIPSMGIFIKDKTM